MENKENILSGYDRTQSGISGKYLSYFYIS